MRSRVEGSVKGGEILSWKDVADWLTAERAKLGEDKLQGGSVREKAKQMFDSIGRSLSGGGGWDARRQQYAEANSRFEFGRHPRWIRRGGGRAAVWGFLRYAPRCRVQVRADQVDGGGAVVVFRGTTQGGDVKYIYNSCVFSLSLPFSRVVYTAGLILSYRSSGERRFPTKC